MPQKTYFDKGADALLFLTKELPEKFGQGVTSITGWDKMQQYKELYENGTIDEDTFLEYANSFKSNVDWITGGAVKQYGSEMAGPKEIGKQISSAGNWLIPKVQAGGRALVNTGKGLANATGQAISVLGKTYKGLSTETANAAITTGKVIEEGAGVVKRYLENYLKSKNITKRY